MKNREHTSMQPPNPTRFIFPTEDKALVWAKRAATWQRRIMFVVKLGSRRFEIVKSCQHAYRRTACAVCSMRATETHLEISPLQEVTKIETNGGLSHE